MTFCHQLILAAVVVIALLLRVVWMWGYNSGLIRAAEIADEARKNRRQMIHS